MTTTRIIGIVALVLGLILLVVGYQSTQAAGEQIRETFTGRWSDSTTWYIIGGIVLSVLGAVLLIWGGPRTAHGRHPASTA